MPWSKGFCYAALTNAREVIAWQVFMRQHSKRRCFQEGHLRFSEHQGCRAWTNTVAAFMESSQIRKDRELEHISAKAALPDSLQRQITLCFDIKYWRSQRWAGRAVKWWDRPVTALLTVSSDGNRSRTGATQAAAVGPAPGRYTGNSTPRVCQTVCCPNNWPRGCV